MTVERLLRCQVLPSSYRRVLVSEPAVAVVQALLLEERIRRELAELTSERSQVPEFVAAAVVPEQPAVVVQPAAEEQRFAVEQPAEQVE